MLHVGCDVSASTTTTGANVCHLIDWDEDQGDNSKKRPSDNPDPKPTSTTSTTYKITPTSPATTTATGKPVPSGLPSSRDDIQFVIFDSNRITGDGSTWHWAGYLLPSLGYGDEDVCNEQYKVISDPHVGDEDQAWPLFMGPFNAPGLDHCFFHKIMDPPSNPGYISCTNHVDMTACIGLDGKHAARKPVHRCTGSGGEKTEFWLQAWCSLKG